MLWISDVPGERRCLGLVCIVPLGLQEIMTVDKIGVFYVTSSFCIYAFEPTNQRVFCQRLDIVTLSYCILIPISIGLMVQYGTIVSSAQHVEIARLNNLAEDLNKLRVHGTFYW